MRVGFLGVVPSPYQTDLLGAFARGGWGELETYWLEERAPDSPWELGELPFSWRVLPGWCWGSGRVRSHWNWGEPDWTRFDVVVVNTSLTDATTQRWMRTGFGGRPWIFWGERQGGRWWSEVLAGPLKGAACILAVGPRAAEDYRGRFPGVVVESFPYYCGLAPFRAEQARIAREGPVRFLFCGQLIFRKGIDVLLEAFARLVESGVSARLILVGRPDKEGEAAWARMPTRARDWTERVGFVPPGRLPERFREADVFVLPSRREGWGVVVNQAAAAGLPLILSDAVEAGEEWLVPGENGWRVPAGDMGALEGAMREAAGERDRLVAMGAASARRAEGRSPEDGAGRLAGVLREVLA